VGEFLFQTQREGMVIMKNIDPVTKILSAFALVTLLAACFERTAIDRPPGRYENDVSSTDSYGTTTERKSTSTVGYDDYGNKKAVIKTKTTRDPPGLLNKTTTNKQEIIEEK
jgi:hypothetical protein